MKLLDKLKDILFDEEEEVEIPVAPKKNVVREEPIAKPVVKSVEKVEPVETKVEEVSERELFHNENTFKFPIFDEDEFESTRKPEPAVIKEKHVEAVRKEINYQPRRDYESALKEQTEERKIFKPSPIISPVYGILDKNYNPEDHKIISQVPIRETPKKLDVDSVRKKAFGNLDEDLERTLNTTYQDFYKEEPKPTKTIVDIIEENANRQPIQTEDDFKTEDLKETLSDIRENLEDIHESINSLETKVESKAPVTSEDLDKPRRAMDLLNEIESELDEITSKNEVSDEPELPIEKDLENINFNDEDIDIDVSDFSSDVTDSSDTNSEELFNLIDAMYDTDKESE